jgi:hypothetical protein
MKFQVFLMSYMIYMKGFARRTKDFEEELLSDLARKGVNISNRKASGVGTTMAVQYTDEEGDMSILPEQGDISISYTATGGPETLKGAMTGSAAGAGIGVITGVLTGRTDRDKILSGVAGAITGGAVGAYRGQEKGMREKISFAKLLAQSVTQTERKLLAQERQAAYAQSKSELAQESLSREKIRLESQLQQLKGQLDSCNTEEDSKKTSAEARHLEKCAQLESRYADKKDLLDKLVASENKRYESEVKQISANYLRLRSTLSSRVSETEKRISMLDEKLGTN